jgi:hypothetical protein
MKRMVVAAKDSDALMPPEFIALNQLPQPSRFEEHVIVAEVEVVAATEDVFTG